MNRGGENILKDKMMQWRFEREKIGRRWENLREHRQWDEKERNSEGFRWVWEDEGINLTWWLAFTWVSLGNGKGVTRNLLGNSLGRITQHVRAHLDNYFQGQNAWFRPCLDYPCFKSYDSVLITQIENCMEPTENIVFGLISSPCFHHSNSVWVELQCRNWEHQIGVFSFRVT